jgi:hypothetical protein
MSQAIRALGFSNSNQQLTWTANYSVPVTAYLWGGGGGGGGNDSNPGGNGSGGGFSQIDFLLDPGDTLTVAVGSPGRGGASRTGSAPGGNPGASYFDLPAAYWGGTGGSAGPQGSSGGGGGGGGASVLLKNNSVIAVAGGGGGGGGGGNTGVAQGQNAPGSQAVAAGPRGNPTGGNGFNKTGDGGGGGAGGGGQFGGQGGNVPSGDQGGFAGAFGTSIGAITANPTNRTPANVDNEYYFGSAGLGGTSGGGPGTAGYAVFIFGITGTYVHDGIEFKPVGQVYVKQNNEWRSVRRTWIKQNGIWIPTDGSFAPTFSLVTGNYGTSTKVCIGVCDENDATSQSTMNSNWNTFLTRFPSSQLFCLQPGRTRGMRVPPNFTSSGQGFGPILVNRDGGNPAAASDWFITCGLGSRPAGSLVEFSIDNSGSMSRSTVQASINLFLTKCSQSGLIVQERPMSRENWIGPFI